MPYSCSISRFFACALIVSAVLLVHDSATLALEVATFDDLMLAPQSAAPADASQSPFTSGGAEFNRTWNSEFDCCPGGWAYSNQTDLSTAGYNNPFSAYVLPAGGGHNGSPNFAIANSANRGEAVVTFPQPVQVEGFQIANSTYGYLAVANGNDGAGFVKGPFAAGDWFRVEVFGVDASGQDTGSVDVYLADFRDGKSDVLSQWQWVDLTSLGSNVSKLEFAMSSTDSGMFGMNTPAYFGVDDLSFAVVPEPTSCGMMVFGMILVATGRLRRRQ